jgi:hypothetical protein
MGVPTHPAPVYEIFWCLIIVGILWWLKGKVKPEGSPFLIMLAIYSLGRFIISWTRADVVEPAVLGPFHQSHIISMVLIAGAVAFLIYRKARWVSSETIGSPAVEAPTDDISISGEGLIEKPSVDNEVSGGESEATEASIDHEKSGRGEVEDVES